MVLRRRPLSEEEIYALNYKQLVDRLVDETHYWEDRVHGGGRMTARARAERDAFGGLLTRYVVDEFMHEAVLRYATEQQQVLAERGPDYWLTRVDGSEPRPPRRVHRSRRRGARLPYGCKVVTRPGIYGNPVGTVDGTDDHPVLRFRNYLEARARLPEIPFPYQYPTDEQIQRDLSYWDLACWCPLTDEPGDRCHADVLLRVAAGGKPAPVP